MLKIFVNKSYEDNNELLYVLHCTLSTMLGLEYELGYDERFNTNRLLIKKENKELVLNLSFFNQFNHIKWLSPESLPQLPLCYIDIKKVNTELITDLDRDIPVIYGNNKYSFSKNRLELGIDLFGSCFFMLSRYEEGGIKEKDAHGRFPVKESLAYKEGFLMRPVVDEYTELLWRCISFLWPDCIRKKAESKTLVSCDVDFTKDPGAYFPGILRRVSADLIMRKSLKEALASVQSFYNVSLLGKKEEDPFHTFDYMMDVCEKQNLKMAFYFIPVNNKKAIDGNYDIESREVIELMQKIIKREHEVGYHASYDSYNDEEKTISEVNLLKKVYRKAGGDANDIIGGRQHFLRWETGMTENNWESAGLSYDTTLGYAEHIGFRCGTSKEYNFYSLLERKPLNFKIRPLLAMEVSLLSGQYMGLKSEEGLRELKRIASQVKLYGGNFTLLWHNSSLRTKGERELFQNSVSI